MAKTLLLTLRRGPMIDWRWLITCRPSRLNSAQFLS